MRGLAYVRNNKRYFLAAVVISDGTENPEILVFGDDDDVLYYEQMQISYDRV